MTDSYREPSHAYLNIISDEATHFAKTTEHEFTHNYPGASEQLHHRLEELIKEQSDTTISVAQQIHANPQTAFKEVHAAQLIATTLTNYGIPTEPGAYSLATALHAEVSSANYNPKQHPTIAILAEYDALPEIGHACGHNLITASGLGAFTALVALIKENPTAFSGRIKFLGTPAEEGHSGKEYMAQAGAFDDVDAAIMIHPFTSDTAQVTWIGRRTLTVTFTGKAAHASSQPFMGVNALDAASLAYQGIGLLRQQMPSSDRVHAVIAEGGTRASIITENATMNLYVRSKYPETLQDLSEKVENVMRGAALMTGCGVDIQWDAVPASLPVRTNQTLTDLWVRAQRRRGKNPQAFGSVPDTLAASTDFGNVSYRVPGIHPVIQTAPESSALHTRDFAEYANTEQAYATAIDAAYSLAAVALDYCTNPQIASDATTEFEAAGGATTPADFFDH